MKRKRENHNENSNKRLKFDVRDKIIHPFMLLVTGTCGSGKTTTVCNLIASHIIGQVDRMIFIVPSYYTQSMFRKFDNYINLETDVITNPSKEILRKLLDQICNVNQDFNKQGKPAIKTFLFMDDVTGSTYIHGGRQGTMAGFATQFRHNDCSVSVITHQATSVTPTIRDNATFVIAFPSNRKADQDWIINEYKCPTLKNDDVRKLIIAGWKGRIKTDDEIGKHFVFIWQPSRQKIRYFSDFDHELIIKAKK